MIHVQLFEKSGLYFCLPGMATYFFNDQAKYDVIQIIVIITARRGIIFDF